MKTSILVRPGLLLAVAAMLLPRPVHASDDPVLYTSSLKAIFGDHMAFSVRGNFDNIDDISATFLDADQDGMVDGFRMQTLFQGTPQGSQTRGFGAVQAGGVALLAFPIISSNNFGLTANSFLPGVPAGASALVPMTAQGTIVVTRPNGSPILSIPLMIDPELLSNSLFANGFESTGP